MSDLFPRATRTRHGYHSGQVEDFFQRARAAYERPGAPSGDMTTEDIRAAAFDLKRGGYATSGVDSALDRLELAFAKRTRDAYVRTHGQDAWMGELAQRAQVLYPRLRRPRGKRFAAPSGLRGGYDRKQVDALLDRITTFFDQGTPLTADEVRAVTFKRRGKLRAYHERTVDAYLARTVDILLGVG